MSILKKQKLTPVTYSDTMKIKSITKKEVENFCKIGTTFRILSDDDPWYIVGVVYDNVKKTQNILVIYKSWAKYKQRWTYKTTNIFCFMMDLAMRKELFKDENGNYVIKDNKKKFKLSDIE